MTASRAGSVLIVAMLAACESVPVDAAHSGTRLKLGWYELEDGLRSWTMEIRDATLGVLCDPVMWSDGTMRCTPEARPVVFRDAGCTMPFIVGDAAYASTLSGTCGVAQPDRWFVPTGEPTTSTDAFQLGPDGTCSRLNVPQPVSGRAATEQSPPDLATLTYVYAGDGRLRIETLTSDDGLLLPVRPYDTDYGLGCENFDNLHFNTNGMVDATSVPCVLDAFETNAYVDETCETPGVPTVSSCSIPEVVVAQGAGPCRAYWSVGDEVREAIFQDYGVCQQVDSDPSVVVYAGAERLEPVTLSRARQEAEGRTNLIYIGDGATRIRERKIFYDTAYGAECQLVPRGANDFECVLLSRDSGVMSAYTDAACTQLQSVTWINDFDVDWSCMPQSPRKYSGDRLIGGPYTDPLYTTEGGGGCVPLMVQNATAYTLGPPKGIPFMHATKVFD